MEEPKRTRPTFLIIGAPRCGTTFLARNLARHPQVFLATGEEDYAAGDLHYFDVNISPGRENHARGMAWYLAHFNGAGDVRAIGEKTADYLSDEDAARLAHDALGPVRILLVVRDPVKRAWSHFNHSRHRLPMSAKFERIAAEGEDPPGARVLSAGLYHRLLQPWVEYFGDENIKVVVQDDLENRPMAVFAAVCDFLGIDRGYPFPEARARINAGSSGVVSHLTARLGRRLRENMPRVYDQLLNGPLNRPLKKLITMLRGKHREAVPEKKDTPASSALVPQAAIEPLRRYYRDDVRALGQFLGRDLEALWWSG